jgi:hypothetical protein
LSVRKRSGRKSNRHRFVAVTPTTHRLASALGVLGLCGVALAPLGRPAFADSGATVAPPQASLPTPAPALPVNPDAAALPANSSTSASGPSVGVPALGLPAPGVAASGTLSPFTKTEAAAANVTILKPRKTSGERILGHWLGKDLTLSGGWTLHGQEDSVSGFSPIGTQLYNDQNVVGQDYRPAGVGALQQNMDMTIQGKILNVFSVNAHLSNSRYGNSFNQTFGFNYKQKGTTLDLGTVNAALPGDELVPFSRSVEGIILGRDFGNHVSMTSFVSLTRAVTQHGSFQGQGTTGPYYMNASSIVPGSEHVQVNGRDLQAGTDYNLDYILGQISFLKGLSINPTDTVTYTYESQSYNTTPGLLTGTRWASTSPNGASYGMTLINQKAVGLRTKNGDLTQYFPVYGIAGSIGGVADPQYKYQLSAGIDTAFPLTVRWQNETLTQNVDYVLNPELHYFQLKRALPADTSETGIASLSCSYRPIQQTSVAGDKSVYGFDTKLRVAPNGTVGLTFAGSKAQAAAQSGTGMTLTSDWHSGSSAKNNAWAFSTTLKNVGQDFSSIDSTATAFQQAQKGVSANLRFAPNAFYNFTTSLTNTQVATVSPYANLNPTGGLVGAAANPVQWAKNQGFTAGVNVTIPRLPTLALTHAQTVQGATGTLGSRSTFTTDGLTASWSRGMLGLTGAITNTNSQGVSVFSTIANNSVTASTGNNIGTLIDQANNGTYSQSVNGASALTSRVSMTLTPAPWLSLSSDLGISRNRTGVAGSGAAASTLALSTARNVGWGVIVQPLRRMSINWTVSNSANGQSTAAFSNTATAAAAGGLGTSQLVGALSGQETRSNNLSLQYQPWDWLSANVVKSVQLALIPGQDNSASNSTTFSLTGNPTRKVQLGLMTTQQTVTYVGGQGNSNNQSATVTSTIGPFGRVSLTSALMRMNYGSATYTTVGSGGSSGGILGGSLGGGIFSGGTTAGLIQQGLSTTLSLQTDYALGGNRSLFARWRSLDQGAGSPSGTTGGVLGGTTPATVGTSYVSTNYRQGTGTVGMEVRFSEIVGFTVNLNLINMADRNNPNYSYHARSLTTDLSARF